MQEEKQQYVNPITGENVDEIIKEREAKERGYLTLEFVLKHLEDENEYVKFFIVDGKKIVVDMERPMTQYKKPVTINHERIFGDQKAAVACNLEDEECLSCGS